MADRVHLDVTQLAGRLEELKAIKTALESDVKVPTLLFGSASAAESKGPSCEKMNAMNGELKAFVDAFALLVDASIQHLEAVRSAFEEADAQMFR